MNCPKCGVELLEHVSFCPLCGSALPDDLWQKKKAARTQAPARKPRRPVKKTRPKTVTMRPTEPAAEKPKTVTMKPVEERPKTVTMRPMDPEPPAPAEAAPGKPPSGPIEETPPPPAKAEEEPVAAPPPEAAAAPEPAEETAPSGETVDMLCPMCDSIVSIPVERPIHITCPKCSEEYYFAK